MSGLLTRAELAEDALLGGDPSARLRLALVPAPAKPGSLVGGAPGVSTPLESNPAQAWPSTSTGPSARDSSTPAQTVELLYGIPQMDADNTHVAPSTSHPLQAVVKEGVVTRLIGGAKKGLPISGLLPQMLASL